MENKLKINFIFIATLTFFCSKALADVSLPFAEYRVLSNLKQVRITVGFIHLPGPVGRKAYYGKKELKQGIFPIQVEAERIYSRVANVGEHKVTTKIEAYPPPGIGYGGALSYSSIKIYIDGKKWVDCTLSSVSQDVDDISVAPGKGGFISVLGSAAKSYMSGDWVTFDKMDFLHEDDAAVITDKWLKSK